MCAENLIGPAVVAACVSGIVTTIGFLINRSTTLDTHKEKLAADLNLAERRFEFEKELAKDKVKLDLQAQDLRRKQELAEELIAGFHEFKHIMRYVRSPGGFEGEGSTRPSENNETPEKEKELNNAFVLHERLAKNNDFIFRLMSREYRSIALFGSEISKPFKDINSIIFKLIQANNSIFYIKDPKNFEKYNNIRYEIDSEKDEILQEIESCIRKIEQICRPVLENPMKYLDNNCVELRKK